MGDNPWIEDSVDSHDRAWEEFYRNRWQYDKVVRSTHGVNCTGGCTWNIHVKDGIVTWEMQGLDYPEISPDLPPAKGDRQRLLAMLQNLIENGVKYMGDQPSPRIEIDHRPHGDETVYRVRDNGIGIDPRYQEKIFGLFERLSTDTEGTGAGLALVKRIVEVHGGRIWAESEGLGKGSTFCFTLPGPPAS